MADWKLEVIWEGHDSATNTCVRLVEAIDPEGREGLLTPERQQGTDATGVERWIDVEDQGVANRILATGVYYALKNR